MSNIQKFSHLQVSTVDDLARISNAMASSGMFTDVRDAAQAMVKIQAGAELGLPPFAAMSGVHIIKGKPVIGAGMMASMVDAHPEYDFEVLEQSAEICSIKFFKNGKTRGISTFTIDDAKKAGTQNIHKHPQNMLYARAMSNGVKWYCPGVFAGPVYVPEEVSEMEETKDVAHEEIKEPKKKAAPAPKEQQAPPAVVARAEQHAAAAKEKRDPDFLSKPAPEPSLAEWAVAEVIQEPAPAPQGAPAEEMITKQQAALLKQTLSSSEVPAAMREKMFASIDTMTKARAEQAIKNVLKFIKDARASQQAA